jgi:hypothetical protein
MKPIYRFRHVISVVVALAGSMLSMALAAPAAFAMRLPASGGFSPTVSTHPDLANVHTVVGGGTPGWQITLIAFGAALLAATLAVLTDRVRAARRGIRVSAA